MELSINQDIVDAHDQRNPNKSARRSTGQLATESVSTANRLEGWEKNEKKIKNEDEISKLIKAFPKDIAALDKRSVLAKVNSQGSGT